MIRTRRFLRIFASLFMIFFVGNALAAGYSCPTYKKYTSCVAGRALNNTNVGNACVACDSTSHSAAGNATTYCYCNSGYMYGGKTGAGSAGSTDTSAPVPAGTACSVANVTVTFNKNGGSGTTGGATTDSGGTAAATKSCPYNSSCTYPTIGSMTRSGYVFNGWGTSSSCTSGTTSGTHSSATTLYACWSACTACSPTNATCSMSVSSNTCTYTTACKANYGSIQNNGKYNPSCTPNVYAITLNVNGGTGGTGTVYQKYATGYSLTNYGSAVTSITPPTRAGWIFNGFYTATSGGTQRITAAGALPSNTTFTAATTLYAQWTQCTACSAGTGATCSLSVSGNACVYTTSCIANYGNIVNNGKYNPSCSPNVYAITLNPNSGTGGTATVYQKYATGYSLTNYGSAVTSITPPTRSGHTFNGFYTATSGGTQRITAAGALPSNTTFTAATTLYAQWTACTACAAGTGASCSLSVSGNTCTYTTSCNTGYGNIVNNGKYNPSCTPNVYTITLAVNGGTGGTATVYEKYATGYSLTNFGTTVTSITPPTRANHVFNGFYTAASGGTQRITAAGALPSNTTFTANTTLTAQWSACTACAASNASCTLSVVNNVCTYATACNTGYGNIQNSGKYNASCSANTYTITFNKQSGTGGSDNATATYNANMPTATMPTRAGYVFNGYYSATTGGTQYYTASGASARTWNLTANTTLYAQWTQCTACSATNATCSMSVVNNVCTYATACNTGYGNIVNTGKYNPSCTANTYTVTLNQKGGSGGTPSVTATYNSPMPAATMPTLAGQTFNGYFDAETGGTQYYTSSGASARVWNKAGAATLYAQWTTCTACATTNASCSISGVGGTCVYTTTCNTGYGNIVNNGKYNASCSALSYTVTFDKQSGTSGSDSVSATYNANMPTATMPTRTGYVFGGYYDATNGGGTQYYNASGAGVRTWNKATAATLYAKWTACTACAAGTGATCSLSVVSNVCTYTTACSAGYGSIANSGKYNPSCTALTYAITFNKQSGTGGSDNATATYNANMPTATMPTRTGYVFGGYYDATSGGTQYYTATGASARTWNKTAATTLYARWTACTACSPGAGATCSMSVISNVCTYTTACSSGYGTLVNNGKYNPSCTALTYTVTFNQKGGSGGTPSVVATFGSPMPAATMPTLTSYSFEGYYDAESGGNQYYTSTGGSARNWNKAANTTLYAQWKLATIVCNEGYYLPKGSLSCAKCLAGYACVGGTYQLGGASDVGIAQCTGNTWSAAEAKSCTPCLSNYTISGTAATDHDAASDCKISCGAGQYLKTANDTSCTDVGSGFWNIAKTGISQGSTTTRNTCPAGSGVGSDSGRGTIQTCFTTCGTKVIDNGTTTAINAKTYYVEATAAYPVCTYNANCNTDYLPVYQGSANPKCVFNGICPENFYCDPEPHECPNGGRSDMGSTDIRDCYKIEPYPDFLYGTANSKCFYTSGEGVNAKYESGCDVTPLSCDAGYHFVFGLACSTVENGYFSPAGVITQTECPAGWSGSDDGTDADSIARNNPTDCFASCDLSVENSTSVTAASNKVYYSGGVYPTCSYSVICKTGFAVSDNNTSNPQCRSNQYVIALNKNGGTGTLASSISCTFNSGSCALPEITALSKAGHTPGTQWCSDANGAAPCYTAGSVVTTNISPTGTAHTLYASWTPNVYTINLNHQSASTVGAPGTVYLKYANDWYSNSAATTAISALTTKPVRGGYGFVGYYSKVGGAGSQIIDSNGNFLKSVDALSMTTTSPATIYASWAVGTTNCPAGKYYDGNQCQTCLENNYCGGGDFGTESGIQGLNACPGGGAALAGSDEQKDCYKINLPYTSPTGNGAGTQRCFYTSGSGSAAVYNSECDTKVITTCKTGYYHASGVDCTVVGNDYYSGEGDKTRTQCPNGGKTTTTTAGTIQECFKTGLDYTASNGAGTQRCFYSSGTGTAAVYANACDTKVITTCKAGYWREMSSDIDCSPVGENYYSPDNVITRSACKDGGLTATTTSSSPGQCFKSGVLYIATHGSGTKLCFYNGITDEYDANCNTITITYCEAGYHRESASSVDCDEVGIGYFSPIADIARNACENGGLTKTTTSTSANDCYLDGVSCPILNGTGENTCNYSSGTGAGAIYAANCTSCLVTECDNGYSQVGNACVKCPENHFCDDGKQTNCGSVGDGTYVYADPGTTDAAGCYKACALGTNAATMKGRDYYIGLDTCEIATCKAGFKLEGGVCKPCPAGMFCDGTGGGDDGDGSESCADLGDGGWKFSAPNASSKNDCYRTCPQYSVTYGTAIPDNLTEYFPDECTYTCKSVTGNTGEIVAGVCVEDSCTNTYEMINGVCKPCNRENALSYSLSGNCEIETCVMGYHPNGQTCEDNVIECTAPNAEEAYQIWDTSKKAFGVCTIKTCAAGYHISSNACVIDEQECVVENGTGYKEWDTAKNKWGECVVTYCKPGFTFDPTLTNELTKPCGQCKNKYSILGELAVSSYTAECDIAACMYQGELYNLEDNECVPICDVNGYEDETGTMKWNPATKKCVRQCKEGFTAW